MSAPCTPFRHRSFLLMLTLVPLAVLLTACPISAQQATDGPQAGQVARLMPSVTTADIDRSTPQSVPSTAWFSRGPKPVWIWGANADRRYVLRTTFELPDKAGAAWMRATCDNEFTLRINGQRVTGSDTWEAPVTVDVSKFLNQGKNTIEADVRNHGGIAAFLCKLVIGSDQEAARYLVSGADWMAAERSDGEGALNWNSVKTLGELGVGPWNDVFAAAAQPSQVLRDVFVVQPGFQVEQLYQVPKDQQGSWVSMTFDHRGRIIASDQGKQGLWRITPPEIGSEQATQVEKLQVPITAAQGLLYAFDSLYISVNGGPGSGLYRARDTDGDDQFDELTKLKDFQGGGEHGPHALRLSPDGQSLFVIAGNHTNPPADFDASRVPSNWGEDLLLPRQWDARGHARGKLAPGGWIARTDPEGKLWEVYSTGYRNPYDMAFNADGELFAYDADMEWDMGMPWYRPTRVVHATSGSEFGWRSGTGKWPEYYPDSLPPTVNIGPGSPVGVTFGYGTRFPGRYQRALYICDWTFGTMYAIHLTPDGSTYVGEKEEFLSRSPLPLTDVEVGPDGALYFTTGGRGTDSALFRVIYAGDASTEPVEFKTQDGQDARAIRSQLESLHRTAAVPAEAVRQIRPSLGHSDRFIRYAARVALEHQPSDSWLSLLSSERSPQAVITLAIAAARQCGAEHRSEVLDALNRLQPSELFPGQQLDLLRAYALVFIRMGAPNEQQAAQLAGVLSPLFPSDNDDVNRELCRILVYLQDPQVVRKTLALLAAPRTTHVNDLSELLARNRSYGGTIASMMANLPDQQKLHYAFVLRNARKGWTPEQRILYFRWLDEAREWSGGASFRGFVDNMDQDAYDGASDTERLVVEASGARKAYVPPELPKPEGPGRNWTLDDLLGLTEGPLRGRNFKNGQRAFAAARCVVCHRFAGDGGATGPDLTQLAGRFNFKDMCEAIVDPSKVISDQYRASVVVTESGKVHTGRIVSETDTSLTILVDPENATKVVDVPRKEIEEMTASRVSLMPADLLKPLNQDEVLDLLAYLLSRGNPQDPMFQK